MRFGKELGLGALMLTLASGVCSAASPAAVSGVVRDTQGVAQMGAMVQVLAAGSVNVATVFTDIYGRYRIANLIPGKYQVRASAALFVPALRNNLQLSTGMRATVNLTLNMLSDPAAWLPAKRRGPDEPGDDWTWTLRSAADRPILRMLDDGQVVLISAGAEEGPHQAPVHAHASVAENGGFGQGGTNTAITLDRKTSSGADVVARAECSTFANGGSGAPSTEVDAGYQRKGVFGDASRVVVSYSSHPEMENSDGSTGVQAMRMANAEKMQLGDLAEVEAGGTVFAIHMAQTALISRPFVHVTVHPGEVWAVEYKLAEARDLQSFDSLDSIHADIPVAVVNKGRISTESGTHQELSVSRKLGKGQIRASVYHDAISHPAIAGAGAMSPADIVRSGELGGVVVDPATDSFRFLGAGYTNNGESVTVSEPLNSSLLAVLEYASGEALFTRNALGEQLSDVSAGLHSESAQSLTAGLQGHITRTGTKLNAAYRWQPQHLVTAVRPYDGASDQAFLSFYVRQAVSWGGKLPPGIDATIDVTNLLAEGYQPFLSADGRTLYLAQSPRVISGGLSFSF
jgi:hypothetical protein